MNPQHQIDIHTRCSDALERLAIIPSHSTRKGILVFAQSLDKRAPQLDILDQIELENAAVEYAVAWATAELLETACGEAGPVTVTFGEGQTGTCRVNPAVAQAASARTRMRQILKAIKALLKSAKEENTPERDADAAAEPQQAAPNTPGTTDVPQESLEVTSNLSDAPHHPTASQGEGDAPAEPLEGNQQLPSSTPHAESEPIHDAQPEAPHAPEPAAPPMNRSQRRAQARLEAKQHRKAQKRLRRAAHNGRD